MQNEFIYLLNAGSSKKWTGSKGFYVLDVDQNYKIDLYMEPEKGKRVPEFCMYLIRKDCGYKEIAQLTCRANRYEIFRKANAAADNLIWLAELLPEESFTTICRFFDCITGLVPDDPFFRANAVKSAIAFLLCEKYGAEKAMEEVEARWKNYF